MNEDKFEWNENLIKEMIYSKLPLPDHYMCNVQKCLDEFKKSKESTIPDKDRDWEILSFYYNSYRYAKTDGLYWNEFNQFETSVPTGSIIQSVRWKDGEVFSIGDIDESCGEITGFKIETDEIGGCYAFTTGTGKSSISLHLLKKVKPKVPIPDNKKDYEVIDYYRFENGKAKIFRVKRLYNNEMFCVDETVTHVWTWRKYRIQRFEECGNGILSFGYFTDNEGGSDSPFGTNIIYLTKIEPKPKVPLFTTEDGVEIFDYKWVSVMENFGIYHVNNKHQYNPTIKCKRFSTKEKAEEYILNNKPIEVSYNELMEFLTKVFKYENSTHKDQNIKDFFKSKINL